jgi:ADP-ribosylation factor-like protein 6
MSGQSKYRSLWERYYSDCHGVIFVIDSSDTIRMAVACNELQLMIQHPEMVKNRSSTGVPILILANKIDLEMAIPIGQVKRKRSWRHGHFGIFSSYFFFYFRPFTRSRLWKL